MSATSSPAPQSARRLAVAAAALTVALIGLGGLTTVVGAGMGCGDDWPLCQGKWLPDPSNSLQVIEWSHRALAALVGLLTLAAGVALWRVRGLAPAVALGWALLAAQAALGRGAVLTELGEAGVLVAHLATSMAFLGILGHWIAHSAPSTGTPALLSLARVALVAVWLQAVLGALVVHTGSQHALWAHIAVGVAVAGLAMSLMAGARRAGVPAGVALPARAAGWLSAGQVALGFVLWNVLAGPGHRDALVLHLVLAALILVLLAVAASRCGGSTVEGGA